MDTWLKGGFHKPIYTLRQTFTPKKASKKFGVERKMAPHPTFGLYEIDPCCEADNSIHLLFHISGSRPGGPPKGFI